jgi:hypothetical protein
MKFIDVLFAMIFAILFQSVHADTGKIEKKINSDIDQLLKKIDRRVKQLGKDRSIGISMKDTKAALGSFYKSMQWQVDCYQNRVRNHLGIYLKRMVPLYKQKKAFENDGLTDSESYRRLINAIPAEKKKMGDIFFNNFKKERLALLNFGYANAKKTVKKNRCQHLNYGRLSYPIAIKIKTSGAFDHWLGVTSYFYATYNWDNRPYPMQKPIMQKEGYVLHDDQKFDFALGFAKRIPGVAQCETFFCVVDRLAPFMEQSLMNLAEVLSEQTMSIDGMTITTEQYDSSKHVQQLMDNLIRPFASRMSTIVETNR